MWIERLWRPVRKSQNRPQAHFVNGNASVNCVMTANAAVFFNAMAFSNYYDRFAEWIDFLIRNQCISTICLGRIFSPFSCLKQTATELSKSLNEKKPSEWEKIESFVRMTDTKNKRDAFNIYKKINSSGHTSNECKACLIRYSTTEHTQLEWLIVVL